MSRLQSIENALKSINETLFQELCDSYLAIRNENYSAFSRVGSQTGKQKTIIGTPDSLLLLPNGKYLFVECSTNITKGVLKLKEDIGKCLDSAKTGIPTSDILEIILCINFNLSPAEIQLLKNQLAKTRIRLTIVSLDSLSIELHLNHRDLTHYYLGLPLDTGQIVSIDQFIKEYNRASKSIATPLDNIFVQRDTEISQLKESLNNSDFIILTGPPGVGKTKLVIEAVSQFLKENIEFNAYCISYKSYALLDDLYQYINVYKDYILFVDDANRIDAFNQITGFYKAERKGKLKVIITVRDYAYQEIGRLCQEFAPIRIDLAGLNDEGIIAILKSETFQIFNAEYQKEIVKIADGNPRLAIMAALLANAHQDIAVLHDVSDLFEKYFSILIKDQVEFSTELNIRCLGLIGFFYTIPYKDREVVAPILEKFGIGYADFLDSIDKLDKLELVEIQFEHVKIPEQNLSIYFFYKAFIKDGVLPFSILLEGYFESNKSRFRECVIASNNTFGPDNVMTKLKPDLVSYWNTISANEDKAYSFLSIFWFYLKLEALEFLVLIITALPDAEDPKYSVIYEHNDFAYEKNRVIELLSEYFRSIDQLSDILELAFRFIKKNPDHLPELIFKIRENLLFDWRDARFGFIRQHILFNYLITNFRKDGQLFPLVFFELSKTFLKYKFQHTEGGRNHSFSWYFYPIPNNQSIQEFRRKIWDAVYTNYNLNSKVAFELLQSYALVNPDVEKEIMAFDVPYLITVIDKHLTNESFVDCRYVQDQIRWCKRMDVHNDNFERLELFFQNKLYLTFLKIDWNRLRDKEMFEFGDYREYERLKADEIRNSFVFNNQDEVVDFYNDFTFLKKEAKNEWNYNNTLEIIVDENSKRDFSVGYYFYELIIERNNEINYVPRLSFKNQLDQKEKIERIWDLIDDHIFESQFEWKLSFFDFLDESQIDFIGVESILQTINSVKKPVTLHFDGLQKYLTVDPLLFKKLLEIIIHKNEENAGIRVWMDFFSRHFDDLGGDINIIKQAYLQQFSLQNHFDYEFEAFYKILRFEPLFLVEYVRNIFKDRKFGDGDDHRSLHSIWDIPNIEIYLLKVFELFSDQGHYFGILPTYLNAFFRGVIDEQKIRSDQFLLNYVRDNVKNPERVNLIVDIVRNERKEIFDQVLLYYISLNQNVEDFKTIWWRGNGGSYSGDVIMGDIEAADWRNVLSIVERSNVGIDLIPIKKYILNKITACLRQGDWERKRRFIERD
jgi:DNA polymerase III delta prime subunit